MPPFDGPDGTTIDGIGLGFLHKAKKTWDAHRTDLRKLKLLMSGSTSLDSDRNGMNGGKVLARSPKAVLGS